VDLSSSLFNSTIRRIAMYTFIQSTLFWM
jgi:hypothetical protein